jgi:hypothetical protein
VWLRFAIRVLNAGGFMESILFVVISIRPKRGESCDRVYRLLIFGSPGNQDQGEVRISLYQYPPSHSDPHIYCSIRDVIRRYLDKKPKQANKPKHLLQYTRGNAPCLNAAKGSDGRAASPTCRSHNWWWQCTHFNVTHRRK